MRALGLLALVLATSSLSLACSSGEETRSGAGGGSGVMPGPAEWNRDVTPPSDDEASQKRASCGYRAGDLPAETQGASRPNGRDIQWETSVGDEIDHNIHVGQGISEDRFVEMREARDKTLAMPKLIIPSLQVNIRGGELPPKDEAGRTFLKVPVNAL